ncbi:MAG: hypothetical protein PV340_02140 [Wolbachia sp.]|nr:hypothetical protein [Wolbachia sp.]MDD9335949.1 hypothetical protein [Wolbachia sp.]
MLKGKEDEIITCKSKEEAFKKAEDLAKKIEMGHVVIHNEKGKFEVVENL